MNRQDHRNQLENEHFDLCIIGGGASGAGCALDAALRGLKVALVEKTDFSAETSSKSTKLIHGGVRYLEQAIMKLDVAQLRQVRHGMHERHLLLQNAPHLTHALPLITPVFDRTSSWYYAIGLKLYDLFAKRKNRLPRSRLLGPKDVHKRLPGLSRKIHGGVLYYDGQIDDARYNLALVQTAARAGAKVLNHAEAIRFEKDGLGKLAALWVHDHHNQNTFRIQARCFLNCTGPFADTIRTMAQPGIQPRIRPSKGVHAVLPREVLGGNDALLIPKTPDGRVVFAVPFENKLMVGTTDEDYDKLGEEPRLEADEIRYLLDTLAPYLEKPVLPEEVTAGFGGLRPLVRASETKKGKTGSMLRDHEVETEPHSGLFSLLGGKWTTYRLMAADALDAVCETLQVRVKSSTANQLLEGAEGWQPEGWKVLRSEFGLNEASSRHVHRNYGQLAHKVLASGRGNSDLFRELVPGYPYLLAEVYWAVREEMALTLRDVLARRIRLELLDWQACAVATIPAAEIMAGLLGWTEDEKQKYIREYRALIDGFRLSAGQKNNAHESQV